MDQNPSPPSPPKTKGLFMLLAWISPLVPCLAIVLCWTYLSKSNKDRPALKQGDRAAFAAAKLEDRRKFNLTTVGTVVASLVGGTLSVVSICGIRSPMGLAIVLPGAALGILSAGIVVVLVGLLHLAVGAGNV